MHKPVSRQPQHQLDQLRIQPLRIRYTFNLPQRKPLYKFHNNAVPVMRYRFWDWEAVLMQKGEEGPFFQRGEAGEV